MTSKKRNHCLALALALSTALLTSCQKTEEEVEKTETNKPSSPLESIILKEAPTNALAISEAIKAPQPGEPITISGEVMGRLDPFIEDRAMVILGDPTKLTPCNRKPGDSCDTPWDVCCDLQETINQSTATIQVLDENGAPIKTGLKGLNGMKELSFLTVTGTVAEGSNDKNLLVSATGIHVAEESPFKDAPPVGD